ncbi:hypothetical protein [Prevotella histicola]|uniref:hypothetical protein n=1 Tax=Prevotella histicola TaxID=470565 RepID=UPI0028E28EF4|nr:hypothetical protein [Prevotella histicola]
MKSKKIFQSFLCMKVLFLLLLMFVCSCLFSSCSKEDDVHEGYAIQRLTVAAYKGKFAAGDKKASKDGLRYVFLLGDGDFAYGPASIPGLDEVYQEGKTYEVELRENFEVRDGKVSPSTYSLNKIISSESQTGFTLKLSIFPNKKGKGDHKYFARTSGGALLLLNSIEGFDTQYKEENTYVLTVSVEYDPSIKLEDWQNELGPCRYKLVSVDDVVAPEKKDGK